jgi:Ras GTPase-activating-like protein IQGAP2/3
MVNFENSTPSPPQSRPHSLAISRSDSVCAPAHDRSRRDNPHVQVERPDLESFQKSSTGYLRTLSKFVQDGEDNFAIKSPDQAVVGLHGRRRLQRSTTNIPKSTSNIGYGGRNWMDQQRQFLQAYEYLCHIGEAKEWIEDIISQSIPPIVQLEEALRDGVTLAEIVQALQPERRFRVFRHPKLQFRHSDNIALFFRFLAEVELPELFRFELVDLYEKKNIPKVIYCIHALSWLLYRKGIVDFRIGNLVGQLRFEDHELEATQKGLDMAGVSMPNFAGMGATFGAEPEPEPMETEEERIDRELAEQENSIVDLQAQLRGAMLRMRLGDMMQTIWDSEDWLIDLQSRIRGDWARQIFQYRLDMRNFAVHLQSAIRGFLVRNQQRHREDYWRGKEEQVTMIQSLLRAKVARTNVQTLKSRINRHEHGIRQFQAAIRGALARRDVGDQWEQTREAESHIESLQAAIRGALMRKNLQMQVLDFKKSEDNVEKLQAAMRGMLQRAIYLTDLENLRQHEPIFTSLQTAVRGMLVRRRVGNLRNKLVSMTIPWPIFQAIVQGNALRASLRMLRNELHQYEPELLLLQARIRGVQVRHRVTTTKVALAQQENVIKALQASIRGFLLRKKYLSDMILLQENTPSIIELQSASRGFLQRQATYDTLCQLNEHETSIIDVQSFARAALLRIEIGMLLGQLEGEEDFIVVLQALARGAIIRKQFAEKKKYFRENMEKVVKIQSFVRGRQQGQAYKSLTSGENPPVGTIKNFVHLLNDSDFDFDEEIGKYGTVSEKMMRPNQYERRIREASKDCRTARPSE